MKISFLVTSHNEGVLLEKVVHQIGFHLTRNQNQDELVILDDFSDDEHTLDVLLTALTFPRTKIVKHKLNGDFGAHKTHGSKQCSGDYIVQLDADEYLSDGLLENIHELIETNSNVDLFRVPRVNIVRGMTMGDAQRWGWHVSHLPEFGDLPIINWHNGDRQSRIYRNAENIIWIRRLHEIIAGASTVAELPLEVDFSIIHDKTIERQVRQNEFYLQNWTHNENMGR